MTNPALSGHEKLSPGTFTRHSLPETASALLKINPVACSILTDSGSLVTGFLIGSSATLSASPSDAKVRFEPHQPHFQSVTYNSLNGGIARHYEPIAADVVAGATTTSILGFCRHLFDRLMPGAVWHIELHQFRIEASTGQAGLPTPEGNHRDGVNFVLVMMVKRSNIASGTTTIFDLAGRRLDGFTLTEPFDAAIVNDERCLHGVTPVIQIDPAEPSYRDVLVVTFRRKQA